MPGLSLKVPELIEARKRGFIRTANTKRGVWLQNQWWWECRRDRRPWLIITNRGRHKADLRLDIGPLNLRYPAPEVVLSESQRSALFSLVDSELLPGGRGFVDPYSLEAFSLAQEGVEEVAMRILAIVGEETS